MSAYSLESGRQTSNRLKGIVTLVGLLVLLVASFLVLPLRSNTTHKLAPAAKVTPVTQQVTTRLQFMGDVFWGRQMQQKAERSGLGYQYITHGLTAADRSSSDAWIANFECPITNRDVPYAQQVASLKFNCRPEYLPNLAKWFTAATLANNHMDNNGAAQGLADTRANLDKNGIQHFSTYDMTKTSDLCEVTAVPALLSPSNRHVQIPIALCGYMYVVDVAPTDAQLAVMHTYAQVMPVIAMPHMGIEYRALAEDAKVSAYHRMIDNGADAVIGAHPHVIQNSESYKGKLIAYSLGNFLFDQQSLGRSTTLGLAVDMQLRIRDAKAVAAYTQVAASCRSYKDTCLTQLNAKLPKRPTIDVTYSYKCYDEAGGVPVLGSAKTCAPAFAAATTANLKELSQRW